TFCISNQVSIYQLLPGTYTISVSGTGGKAQLLMISLIRGGNPQPGGHYHFDLTYTLKKSNEVMSTFCISNQVSIYQLLPGTYTISVSGTGGKAQLLM
ncbi:hypothetical protein, partial [Chryseobacterium sp. CH1]|uniref:hypothetical protein n=1 Tax=Chryseobacterium sp. CH1 TaxID=713551 RepID=UPI00102789E5